MTTETTSTPQAGGLKRKLKWFFLLTLLVMILLTAGIGSYLVLGHYSDGYRVGTVIKLSHKGWVMKTWEGQIDQGFLTQDQNSVATRLWDFSVADSEAEVRHQIDEAIAGGYKVKLYYKEKFYKLGFLGDTKYFVYKVERAGN